MPYLVARLTDADMIHVIHDGSDDFGSYCGVTLGVDQNGAKRNVISMKMSTPDSVTCKRCIHELRRRGVNVVDHYQYRRKKHRKGNGQSKPRRRQISTTLRFSILERDGFTCRYCGAKAPDVKLEVDHVKPVSAGGTNDESNLVTACKTCNIGKRARLIDGPPTTD